MSECEKRVDPIGLTLRSNLHDPASTQFWIIVTSLAPALVQDVMKDLAGMDYKRVLMG